MRSSVKDQLGHEIYLTDERWQHIYDEHPEMHGYRDHVLETVRNGSRFQDSVRPQVYLYYREYQRLPDANTTIVVVVYFSVTADGAENNFVLTAYQIRRRRRQ
jgi:hypothetical protein